jgi:hypothetical protein
MRSTLDRLWKRGTLPQRAGQIPQPERVFRFQPVICSRSRVATAAPSWAPLANCTLFARRPSAFQAGHIPSWRGLCESYALLPVAAGSRWPLLSSARHVRALGSWSPPLPPSDSLLPPCSPEGRCQGLIRVYVNRAVSPVFVVLRLHRPLMPYGRRMTVRRQSGGGLCSFRGHPGPGGHRQTAVRVARCRAATPRSPGRPSRRPGGRGCQRRL